MIDKPVNEVTHSTTEATTKSVTTENNDKPSGQSDSAKAEQNKEAPNSHQKPEDRKIEAITSGGAVKSKEDAVHGKAGPSDTAPTVHVSPTRAPENPKFLQDKISPPKTDSNKVSAVLSHETVSHDQTIINKDAPETVRRKQHCVNELNAILKMHGGLESNIGMTHRYWDLLKEYRTLPNDNDLYNTPSSPTPISDETRLNQVKK